MHVRIEDWLEKRGYDLDAIEDDVWNSIESQAEELGQIAIDEDMDNIGMEITLMFNLSKRKQ